MWDNKCNTKVCEHQPNQNCGICAEPLARCVHFMYLGRTVPKHCGISSAYQTLSCVLYSDKFENWFSNWNWVSSSSLFVLHLSFIHHKDDALKIPLIPILVFAFSLSHNYYLTNCLTIYRWVIAKERQLWIDIVKKYVSITYSPNIEQKFLCFSLAQPWMYTAQYI